MRFFSGSRSGDKKKVSASEIFKKQMMGGGPRREKTQAEMNEDRLEAKMAQMMEDAIMGRKKAGHALPGVKPKEDVSTKPLSKNAQMMLKMLALQRLKRDQKKEKKKLQAEIRAIKAQKAVISAAQAAEEATLAAQQAEAAAVAAAAAEAAAKKDNDSWW